MFTKKQTFFLLFDLIPDYVDSFELFIIWIWIWNTRFLYSLIIDKVIVLPVCFSFELICLVCCHFIFFTFSFRLPTPSVGRISKRSEEIPICSSSRMSYVWMKLQSKYCFFFFKDLFICVFIFLGNCVWFVFGWLSKGIDLRLVVSRIALFKG